MEETAAQEWKSLCDKYVHLSKCVSQSRSGALGVDVINREDADFMRCVSFLQNCINRRKRLEKYMSVMECIG